MNFIWKLLYSGCSLAMIVGLAGIITITVPGIFNATNSTAGDLLAITSLLSFGLIIGFVGLIKGIWS